MTPVHALPLRKELRGQQPYGAPHVTADVRLDVNESPYPPPDEVVADIARAILSAATSAQRYPDREAVALRTELAQVLGHGLDVASVWAANGSNEVMLQLLQAFGGPGRTALSFTPTYSMYAEYCRTTGTRYEAVPRGTTFGVDADAAIEAIARVRPSVVLVASPNNPTGTTTPVDVLEQLSAAATDAVVVVDEAYAEFRSPGVPSALELLPRCANLVVTRTLSKGFGLAGLRVGYAATAPAVVDAVRLVRLPYHLSTLTQAAACAALQHRDVLLRGVAQVRAERDALIGWLRARHYDVPDSDANFVLVGTFDDRHHVWQALVEHGVLVRETGPDGYLRVSIGRPGDNAAFRAALDAVTGNGAPA